MDDLEKARQLLESSNYTCVLCAGDAVHTATHRGVRPLLEFLEKDMSGFSAADKVVGKAAALLYCLMDIRALHAQVISDAALRVLNAHSIPISYDRLVPYIQNRDGTGRCPMETATWDIDDPAQALTAIQRKLKELQK